MKKKSLVIVLCLMLLAVAAVGGSMAYFTDTDKATNVMTTGKVNISQSEQQKDDEGNLIDFVQDKALMPAVYKFADGENPFDADGYFDKNKVRNVVDKIITVKNEAEAGAVNQDAYVRTILAFETRTSYVPNTSTIAVNGKTMFHNYMNVSGDLTWLERDPIMIDGVEYVLAVKVYEEALAPQQVTAPSLKQIFMAPTADNEVAELFGEEYTILALSQGTQTAGFDDADDALNTAFGILDGEGCVSDETLSQWFTTN